MSRSRKENLWAIGVAFVLSLIVFVALSNMQLLQADITGWSVSFSEDSDLVSYIEDGVLHLAVARPLQDAQSMSILVFYDPETVRIDQNMIDSTLQVDTAQWTEGQFSVIIPDERIAWLANGDDIITFDLVGDINDVSLGDIIVTFEDGSSESLSLAIR